MEQILAYDYAALIILFYALVYQLVRRIGNRLVRFWSMTILLYSFIFCIYNIVFSLYTAGQIRLWPILYVVLTYIFVLCINWLPAIFLSFTRAIIYQGNYRKPLLIVACAVFVCVIVINPFTNVFFTITDNGIECGPCSGILWIISVFYTGAYIYNIIKNHKVYGFKTTILLIIVIVLMTSSFVFFSPWMNSRLFALTVAIAVSFLTIFYYNMDDTYDTMTDVMSHDGFIRHAQGMLRNNPSKDYVMVVYDIMHLKDINANYGMKVGDHAIKEAANKLSLMTGKNGVVGRLGNDDFVVCMRRAVFEEIDPDISFDMIIEDTFDKITVNLNVGVYEITDRNSPIPIMCDRAQLATKNISGNYIKRIAYFDDAMQAAEEEMAQIEREMFSALADGQFEVYYQPIVDVQTEKIVSAEALIRWIHPVKGMIPPFKFIELFENNGFINNLDEEVMRQVCYNMKAFADAGNKPVPVSVNVSPYELDNDFHLRTMAQIIIDSGVDSSFINSEITESSFISDSDKVDFFVKSVKSNGGKVLMDDFGSGYSSLNSLRNIAVDVVKLDMRFLEKDEEVEKGKIILKNIINMIKELGMMIVVEGVETAEQVELLRAMGVDRIQGYYYYKPMPKSEFEKLLLDNK